MKRTRNLTIRKPFTGGRSLYGPGLIRTKRQKRIAAMVRKRRSAGLISDSEYKRLSKSARARRPGKKKLEGLFHELYGRSENPMSQKKKKKKSSSRPRKGVMPAGLRKYWAKKRAQKRKRSNPKKHRTTKKQRTRNRRRKPSIVTRVRTIVRKVYAKNPKPVVCPVRLTPSEQKKHSAWLGQNFKRKK